MNYIEQFVKYLRQHNPNGRGRRYLIRNLVYWFEGCRSVPKRLTADRRLRLAIYFDSVGIAYDGLLDLGRKTCRLWVAEIGRC
jgi:hypothetical protein